MEVQRCDVTSAADLLAATGDKAVVHIRIVSSLTDVPTLRLSPGQILTGSSPCVEIRFAPGQRGLQLSTDNRVEDLHLIAAPGTCALFNDATVETLGTIVLRRLSVVGLVQILACDRVRGGHVQAHDIDVVAADARGEDVRPKGFGVEVIPGAFTLWNQQADPAVTITADLIGLTAGRAGAPVRASGIFVGGAGDTGGRLIASRVETGAVYSDAGIAPGTPDRISGGVFVVSGAFVDVVRNCGPVTTYGQNDMALDNWGTVDRWITDGKVTSYGPSGIGFVNFGSINTLQMNAPIETFGRGARGFNVYAGTVNAADFDRVVTHADGAVGIQISQPVGRITVRRGIETHGGTGESLVKGVVVQLSATALSVKPGGSVRSIEISGGLVTHGKGAAPLEVHGAIGTLQITGGIDATGGGFEGI